MSSRLGRGLDALISSDVNQSKEEKSDITTLKIEEIKKNPYQPRKVFDNEKLEELSLSIKENGLIQPIIVTKTENGYEIIAGERRYLAAKMAGLTDIPVIIKNATAKEKLQYAIVENVQREDLNAIEEAKAYEQLHKEFSLTHKEIANLVGKERVTISNLIRLLKLPPKVQHMVLAEKITSGHARVILSVDNKFQQDFADYIAIKNISVRYAEKLAKKINELDSMDFILHKEKNILKSYEETERKLKKKYNVKIKITNKNSKGKIQFYFNSDEELNELLEKLEKNEDIS